MIYPQFNECRQYHDLSGIWKFQFDPNNQGLNENWINHFPKSHRFIAVPASWNDQFEDFRDYVDIAWYKTQFHLPWGYKQKKILLRFGSIHYFAQVWLNGSLVGHHEGGNLPFQFDVTSLVRESQNNLVLRVDGALSALSVPPGNVTPHPLDTFQNNTYPSVNFDFFPFCGVQRPVFLLAVPEHGFIDITITSKLLPQDNAQVQLQIQLDSTIATQLDVHLSDLEKEIRTNIFQLPSSTEMVIEVPNAKLWSPESPFLYQLDLRLKQDAITFDHIQLPVGIREIRANSNGLFLNNQRITLKGFGRHEDFPILGRGSNPAVLIKDLSLMKWVGANSFRTSHYPYSEDTMALADKMGFLVIDETPSVGLFFEETGLAARFKLSLDFIKDLIERDKNHPCVFCWSIANEPHSARPNALHYLKEMIAFAKQLDSTRLVSFASFRNYDEEALHFCDLICLNRYLGWYSYPGCLSEASVNLSQDLDSIFKKFQKPILLTEFGADALAGHHAQPPEMFSEEYQSLLIAAYLDLLNTKQYIIGQHIWTLCDFKTAQAIHRIGGLNLKGVFTRDRRPKLAAHLLKKAWNPS